jgi:hypothetical protein
VTIIKPPDIDPRTRAQIAEQTRQLMCKYLGWSNSADGGEAGRALTAVFARLCSLVVERINRAPEKNFLAFLDMLGNTLVPATSARAPLSFTLAGAALDGVLVPSGTRLYAPAPPGADEPIYFETDDDLWLTTLELQSFSYGDTDVFAEKSCISDINLELFKTECATYIIGFTLPEPRQLPVGLAVVLYFEIESPDYLPVNAADPSNIVQSLKWEYSIGVNNDSVVQWRSFHVDDHTKLLTTSGTIVFEVPADFAPESKDPKIYWVRFSADNNALNSNPAKLRWIATNTVMANQAATVTDEIIGSSNGTSGQRFNTLRRPLRTGQKLEVLERVLVIPNQSETRAERIVWEEVTDFYASGSGDRHYMLERDAGTVIFGNGQNGMIPPPGVKNIRMISYQYGGGIQGNVPAGTISSFWSSLPQVDKVTNHAPAQGGAEQESYESLLERAPKVLRHRNRAVSKSDYEDLAMLASEEVALARCLPLIDLAKDAYAVNKKAEDEKQGVGKVSLIIVPKSSDTKPLPSQSLIRQVRDFILPKASPLMELSVVGPLYLQVNVTIDIRVTSMQLTELVRKTVKERLHAFLHPLTGRGGQGWDFGREPHPSDFYAELSDVYGIEYIVSLELKYETDKNQAQTSYDIINTGRFLICSGEHTIKTI